MMQQGTLQQLYQKLCLSSVFIGVVNTPVFRAFGEFVQADGVEKISAYAKLVARIYKGGGDLGECVKRAVFEDENVYIKGLAHKQEIAPCIQQSAMRELDNFETFAHLTPADFATDLGLGVEEIPTFEVGKMQLKEDYRQRLCGLHKYGYGIFSSQTMFRLSDDKKIEPIVSADKISMDDFVGYEAERDQVVANTRAFVEGRPAANTLLCGDAGTGKSSTVKAVANAFFEEGVRLIELRKDQLSLLPYVMGKISGNPLKFIVFIDDLSFNQNDDNFSMLKAALEGSASAKADNAVIYATSNRRHIVKENFSDRDGDDVHRNDTLQETLSLSERFGLVVLYSKPSKALYLQIVRELAEKHGVGLDVKELELQAEAFALKKGSRSARCAEQFIQSLL